MIKTIVHVNGIKCSMCEEKITEGIKNAFDVSEVTISREKCLAEILSKDEISDQKLKELIDNLGFEFVSSSNEKIKNKCFFNRLFHKD